MNWWIIAAIVYVIGVFGWYFFACCKEGHEDYDGKFHNGLDEFMVIGIIFWPITLVVYILVQIFYYVLVYPFKLVERMASNVLKMKKAKNVKNIVK